MLYEIAEKHRDSEAILRSRLDAAALRNEARDASDIARDLLGKAVAAGRARRWPSSTICRRAWLPPTICWSGSSQTGGAVERESTARLQERSQTVAFDRGGGGAAEPIATPKAAPRLARLARAALVPLLVLLVALGVVANIALRSVVQTARRHDVAREHLAMHAVFVSGPIRVASLFTDRATGSRVAVVDGSWYQRNVDDAAREKAVREIARHAGVPKGPLTVRDYLARPMAVVDSGGRLSLAKISPP